MSTYRRKNRFVRFTVSLIFLLILGSAFVTLAKNVSLPIPYLSANLVTHDKTSGIEQTATPNHRIKIVIDPGHGGKDPGATGDDGKMEKDFTLSLGLKVFELLEKDLRFQPQLTRSDDTFIELEDRAGMANEWNADALVSIHGNTYSDQSVGGTETYYRYESSFQLAQSIHRQVVKAMGFRDREVREDQLKVLTLSNMPATLVEVGYLTNPHEEGTMFGKDGQARAAKAIVEGIKQYFSENP
ncbi:N-acetylmuramoyl-L-alanine amidase [Paenibacillus sp. 5J-6]|uniref:N-acetylmuramoyl-L-alanine amidase n=1 Tax=Paenibacillus silvestris TaxID=2606219 RepID=A0A6L8USU0_9BACL|nr:N-acetylmuramoyl-L-alanine amidase [Paenibacillus silvestris]MZQ81178.1 N-acetylmuramoyl-L-alanine amidase [Paenibacillus silvestris]